MFDPHSAYQTNQPHGGCYDTAKRNKGKLALTIGGTTQKFRNMAMLYRYFARDWEHCCDFSNESLVELYNAESYGTECRPDNGYLVGKRWLNATVAMWKEDLEKGLLTKIELYDDPMLPRQWLESVLRYIIVGKV